MSLLTELAMNAVATKTAVVLSEWMEAGEAADPGQFLDAVAEAAKRLKDAWSAFESAGGAGNPEAVAAVKAEAEQDAAALARAFVRAGIEDDA